MTTCRSDSTACFSEKNGKVGPTDTFTVTEKDCAKKFGGDSNPFGSLDALPSVGSGE